MVLNAGPDLYKQLAGLKTLIAALIVTTAINQGTH
jgi:hypothetical protein